MLHIEKPELLNIIEGPAALHGSFDSRPSHCFVFKLSGESVYQFPEGPVSLSRGEMLYIPQGLRYSFHKTCAGESRYLLINFSGEVSPLQPKKLRLDAHLDFDHFCRRLYRVSLPDSPANRYNAYSLFYQVLALLCEAEKPSYLAPGTAQLLQPAVEQLQQSLYDPGLKIGQLHRLCGISDTYFRRLFIARFGTSPKQYVLQQRLRKARAMLQHGEYNSIGQVAVLCGFDDPLYFSRQYRKAYGHSPSESRLSQLL